MKYLIMQAIALVIWWIVPGLSDLPLIFAFGPTWVYLFKTGRALDGFYGYAELWYRMGIKYRNTGMPQPPFPITWIRFRRILVDPDNFRGIMDGAFQEDDR